MNSSSLKVSVIGAGSHVFGSSLLHEALVELKLDAVEFHLVDPNAGALEAMAAFGRTLAERMGRRASFHTHASWDDAGALDGADLVVHSAAQELARRYGMDCRVMESLCPEEAILEFGGVAGISYSLRQIHLVEKLCRQMQIRCPAARLFCTANPLPRVCQFAMGMGVETIGFCSAWLEGFSFLSQFFSGTPEDDPWLEARCRWRLEPGGLNHFVWATRIEDRSTGRDVLPELLRAFAEGSGCGQPLGEAQSVRCGAWLLPNDHHVRDFLPNPRRTHRREYPMHGSPSQRREAVELLLRAARGEVSFKEAVPHPSWEKPMRVAAGLLLGARVELDTLNLRNSMGQIPGLPSSVFVETPCEIRDGILHPRRVHLPPPALEACLRAAETTQAIVEAAQSRSLAGLRRCCELDPTVRSPEKAFTALKECLRVHEDLLPVYS